MAGHHRERGPAEMAPELFHIAAAHSARLDSQQAVVGADRRARELPDLDLERPGLDCGTNEVSH